MILESLSPIANHLWQSTLFAGVAGLLTLALRKNSARVRHWVWVAASVKFLVPFSILIAIGSRIEWRAAPAIAPNVSVVMERVSQPFTATNSSSPMLATVATAPNPLPAILLGIWACVFIGISISWWIRWRRINASVRAGSPVQLQIPIRAVSSPTLLEPSVFGVFKPVLLLPEGIFEHLTPEQRKTIIAHELCHVRHRDNLVGIIQMFVETVFWFNPLVWWVGKRISHERERACDEEVLRLGSEPRTYAQGILKVCEFYLESPLPCVPGVSGANLKRRIEEIMSNRIGQGLNPRKKLLLAGTGAFAVALPIVVGIVDVSFIQAQSQQPVATPKFEVASIRRCDGPRPGNPLSSSPGRLTVNCGTVAQLIQQAYTRRGANGRPLSPPLKVQIEGGPSWIYSDRYEINAKAENYASWQAMLGPMMQALLEDRFTLKLRRESREIPAYGLVLSKNDAKLRQLEENNCTPLDLSKPFDPTAPFGPSNSTETPKAPCKGISMGGNGQEQSYTVTAQGAILDQLSALYPIALDRPVVNKTGITGAFTFHLEFAMDVTTNRLALPANDTPPAETSDPGPSIFTALETQLGLKLEKTTGPAEFLVIDSIERPSEN